MSMFGELAERIDELAARAVADGQVPGAVVAVAGSDLLHVATAGVMAVGGAPMRRDTLFRIVAITTRRIPRTRRPS